MARIGSCEGRVTVLVKDGLWLQSDGDHAVDCKLKASDVQSYLRTSFAGCRPLVDALASRDIDLAVRLVTAFHDASHIGRFKIMKYPFDAELSPLWGYPPGRVF